jgi:lipoyl(octanoyl) transferase
VDGRKIAQLGLRVRHGASYHGLSLNVRMDLTPFQRIHPCGYVGLETIDLASLPGAGRMSIATAKPELLDHLLRNLGYNAVGRSEPVR